VNVVRFDEALKRAIEFVDKRKGELGEPIVLVRDLYGRIRIAIRKRPDLPTNGLEAIGKALREQLGAFGPGTDPFLFGEDLVDPSAIFDSRDLVPVDPTRRSLLLLDRRLVGGDWLRAPTPTKPTAPPRATLFGIKGGVGRSTALSLWAWSLARENRKVLVIDLDLESPGITGTLFPTGTRPAYGVVDWLVEDAVDQADDDLIANMLRKSPVADTLPGDVWVVPAGGIDETSYLSKLSRAYFETRAGDRHDSFAARLNRLTGAVEAHVSPDVVLIDSRAGLHDIAAAAITQLGAFSFLFAANTGQTWKAYRLLFEAWRSHSASTGISRDTIQMVAALVPETNREAYINLFRDSAYGLFSDTLYVQAKPAQDYTFNYDLNDEDVPHNGIPIIWNRAFQEFELFNLQQPFETGLIDACFGSFFKKANALLFGEAAN